MRSDTEAFRRHFAALSDEALTALSRDDFNEAAQRCYDEELISRRIPSKVVEEGSPRVEMDVEPDWSKDAACAWSLQEFPGNDAAANVADASKILEKAEVPCNVVFRTEPPENVPEQRIWELMVPNSLILRATSVLDKEYFNPELEAEWTTHFEAMSDEDLLALKLQDLTAGLADRLERLSKTYIDERTRRGF